MTPQELREIASKSVENEYAQIMQQLTEAAQQGKHSCTLSLSDAVFEKLKKEGFSIVLNNFTGNTDINW